jgi:hypothetical protein
MKNNEIIIQEIDIGIKFLDNIDAYLPDTEITEYNSAISHLKDAKTRLLKKLLEPVL